MRRRVLELRNAVLRQLAASSLVVLCGLGSALAQSGEPKAQEQNKPAAVRFFAAVVWANAVAAGSIDSSTGRARVTPSP